ncbi:MAG: Crp/Fnr family transcriptional regulator [Spirochaetaceae bacterium]|nr:Crp/Fnr family transcriptional regulator [Spirochaetaceae bacterium]
MNDLDEFISGTPLEQFLDGNLKNKIRLCRYVGGAKLRLPDSILFLMKGTVFYSYGDSKGNLYHVVFTRAFNCIGELIYFYDRKITDIFALEDSVVVEIPSEVIGVLEKDKDFKVFILELANNNLMELTDKMLKRNIYKLENYLAYIILTDQFLGKYYYKSMTALASVFNVSRRNLYYAADSLVNKGLIRKDKDFFEIINEQDLRKLI